MSALGEFLDFAMPLAKETLVPIVRAFFQSHPQFPVPPSVQPYLDAKAHHAAIAQERLKAEAAVKAASDSDADELLTVPGRKP